MGHEGVRRLIQPQQGQYIVRAPARSDSGDEETYIRARQLENWRQNQFLLLLADRFVFTLSDELVKRLGAITAARAVMISAERRRHILERRALVSQLDADVAAHRIHEALEDCGFLMPQRTQDIYEVIGCASSADRRILVALKLVPAARSATKQDEWWVQTAHPFGEKRFRRYMASGKLRLLR